MGIQWLEKRVLLTLFLDLLQTSTSLFRSNLDLYNRDLLLLYQFLHWLRLEFEQQAQFLNNQVSINIYILFYEFQQHTSVKHDIICKKKNIYTVTLRAALFITCILTTKNFDTLEKSTLLKPFMLRVKVVLNCVTINEVLQFICLESVFNLCCLINLLSNLKIVVW